MSKDYVIDVSFLEKTFDGLRAVYDFHLQLEPGKICGFLGPNGSGKTTSLRMVCGLLTPDSGSGKCLGYDVLTEQHKIHPNIGYMPQKFSLYRNLTIHEILNFYASLYNVPNKKKRVDELIQEFELEARLDQKPSALSGGWCQRLALVVCVLHSPQLLLLDEPTAGVDPDSRQLLWLTIQKLARQGTTLLVSTHYMDEAERCNQLIYLAFGELVASGTKQEIIDKTGIHTREIYSDHPNIIYEDILNDAHVEVDQVIQHGDHIRMSDTDDDKLNALSVKIDEGTSEIKTVDATLEDCFIYLSRHNKDHRMEK